MDCSSKFLLFSIRLIAAIAMFTGFNLSAPAQFEDAGANLTGVGDASIAWGDYDRDGDLDLLIAGHTDAGPFTELYQNQAGSFIKIAGTQGM